MWVLVVAIAAKAQTFNSGSMGADGALNITSPGVTVFTQKPVGGGSIFNFTTINIATGSTLQLSGQFYPTPLFFLAQGAVTISGTVDLNGQQSVAQTPNASARTIGTPGAGGYAGGLGPLGSNRPQAGAGPGGGAAATASGACGNFGVGGKYTGNQFLVPLIGGSGGGGGYAGGGGGGGAGTGGGGAILIASSASITINGAILANGGPPGGFNSGTGSGGGIRLVANSITGNGQLSALAGNANNNNTPCGGAGGPNSQGTNGIIRMEAFQNTFTGNIPSNIDFNAPTQVFYGSPYNLFLPTDPPASVSVVSIGGIPVAPTPTGTFTVPDVTVNSSSPVTVQIQGQSIPLGTTVTLFIFSENGPDQTIVTTGLTGTVAASAVTAQITLPPGFSRGFVTASWTQ
jgi:hypothetical protein